jgi:hypothetical protein
VLHVEVPGRHLQADLLQQPLQLVMRGSLLWCHSGVTLMLHWCYIGVTVLLHYVKVAITMVVVVVISVEAVELVAERRWLR